ncbi:FtsQ-type POTRA domain-containing protein [Planotetraspora sp. A-T 1434]|uniref:cell division protein FtsQ/DivIB n=1 Tax=Planotetraspora sp. A-T 1434 TaxID=2979219 RepID=UPI0021BF847B|nr:FtsQ-type POTRA domain-containing protein [Planotetraspora sp. A-T 1434]MCT9930651.1 FtsQ-type POTRA domain-containing protein [Planotetraspora sp. A-T 1434]
MRPAVRRAAIATLLSGGVVGAATWVVFFSPVLGVRVVEITGNTVVPAEQLRLAAGVRTGTPLATVDLDAVEQRVEAVREVESARVERSWPGTVRVTVVERTPVAAVPLGRGRSVVVDRFGVALREVAVVPPRLPVLRVQRFAAEDPATGSALTVLSRLPEDVLRRVREVRAPSPKSVTLTLTDGRTVVWGDARRAAEKGRLLLAVLGKPATSYDVSSPGVVTVK